MINGTMLASEIRGELKEKLNGLKTDKRPKLLVICPGDNAASLSYVRGKKKACKEVGIDIETIFLDSDADTNYVLKLIDKGNSDPSINGILVQLPLPSTIDEAMVINKISPIKDVDGFHPVNAAKLYLGDLSGPIPCTPLGIIKMIESVVGDGGIDGKNACVVGRSNIVGLPVARLLLKKNATVTVCHSKTRNLKEITKNADILVVAIGIPGFIDKDYIKKDAVLIDVGINRVNGKIVGDLDPNVKEVTDNYSPVPGGVGPMTITGLISNTIDAFIRMNNL